MASITPTAICNMALRRVSNTRLTSFENDTTKEAVTCRDMFHPARRSALAAYPWAGAVRSTSLTQDATITPTFFSYAYTLPDDYLRILTVHPSNDPLATMPYILENISSKDVKLLADGNQCYVSYIFDNTDLNTLSPGFHNMFAFCLARDLAPALGKSASAAEFNEKAYRRELLLSKSIDGMEKHPEVISQGSWIKSRFGLHTDKSIPDG